MKESGVVNFNFNPVYGMSCRNCSVVRDIIDGENVCPTMRYLESQNVLDNFFVTRGGHLDVQMSSLEGSVSAVFHKAREMATLCKNAKVR